MKLRNKKTGLIVDFKKGNLVVDGNMSVRYNSLADLNADWEDYKEPKTFWYMTAWGDVKEYSQDQFAINQKQAIGNYFETKEEAEKAVEKLKAWKRLKDKGFKFKCWYGGSKDIWFSIPQEIIDKPTAKDLDLLFGGEE